MNNKIVIEFGFRVISRITANPYLYAFNLGMVFRSGQYYMNFVNTLKLFTANIKSFDLKSNCTNLSSSFKI